MSLRSELCFQDINNGWIKREKGEREHEIYNDVYVCYFSLLYESLLLTSIYCRHSFNFYSWKGTGVESRRIPVAMYTCCPRVRCIIFILR